MPRPISYARRQAGQRPRVLVLVPHPGQSLNTHRTPYSLRHTYAAFSIAAGVSLFALARRMGTSVEMIDKTYGHLLPDAVEYERGLLDAFDATYGQLADTGE